MPLGVPAINPVKRVVANVMAAIAVALIVANPAIPNAAPPVTTTKTIKATVTAASAFSFMQNCFNLCFPQSSSLTQLLEHLVAAESFILLPSFFSLQEAWLASPPLTFE